MGSTQPPRWKPPLYGGFTIIELLIGIGIIGILAAVVIVAVNPTSQLEDAKQAEMRAMLRELNNATMQLLASSGTVPNASSYTGIRNAGRICKVDNPTTLSTCLGYPTAYRVDLSGLVADYLTNLPESPNNPSVSVFTGYYMYREGAFHRFCIPDLDATCAADVVEI